MAISIELPNCQSSCFILKCSLKISYHQITKNTHEKCEKQKVYNGCILCHFFNVSQHFVIGSAFTQNVKTFTGSFFHNLNKTQNLNEKIISVQWVLHVSLCILWKHSQNTSEMRNTIRAQPALTNAWNFLWINANTLNSRLSEPWLSEQVN